MSIMATILGDVQYSQNGTFTNPWQRNSKMNTRKGPQWMLSKLSDYDCDAKTYTIKAC